MRLYAQRDYSIRAAAAKAAEAITNNPNVTVVPHTRELFRRSLEEPAGQGLERYGIAQCDALFAPSQIGAQGFEDFFAILMGL